MNLCTILLARASERPDQPAIIEPHAGHDRAISFAQLSIQSASAAALLHSSGIRPGDRVLLLIPMSIDLYAALIGILRLGAVVTLLDPSAGRSHIDRCCLMAEPAAMIATTTAHALRLLSAPIRDIPRKFVLGRRWLPAIPWDVERSTSKRHELAPVESNDPALLTLTSGSTGLPKAAVRSHGLLFAQQQALAQALNLIPGSKDLTTLPVFVLSNLAAGVTSIIPDANLKAPGSIDPRPVLSQIDRHSPSSVVASPALLCRLAEACAASHRTMPSFRSVFTGGAPVFWHTLDALARATPSARVVAVYGSTEAEPIAEIALNDLTAADRHSTQSGGGLPCGIPVPQVRLRIIPDQWGQPLSPMDETSFEQLSLPASEKGEIVVTGPHVLSGYLDGQGDSETKFRVGSEIWHRTGDSGYLDTQGRLWLTGRCREKLSDSRGVLYPLQVEAAAHAAMNLRRVAFVRLHSQRVLIVETENGLDPTAASTLKASLAWAHIDRVLPLHRIPVDRRHNAKIDYPTLQRMLLKK